MKHRKLSLASKRRIQKAKGDLLDQKWMTYFLAAVLILLIAVFVVLSSPEYKKWVVDTARSVFYGTRKQEAPRPRAAPVNFQLPSFRWQAQVLPRYGL